MFTYAPNFIVNSMKVVKQQEKSLKKLEEEEKKNSFSLPVNLTLKGKTNGNR